MGPEMLSSTGAGIWRKALVAFQTPVLYWTNLDAAFFAYLQLEAPRLQPIAVRLLCLQSCL